MNKQSLITDMLGEYERRENEFPVINGKGKFCVPVLSKHGIVQRYDERDVPHAGYRGIVLEINDHGNVTVWRYFKNGNTRELASRV